MELDYIEESLKVFPYKTNEGRMKGDEILEKVKEVEPNEDEVDNDLGVIFIDEILTLFNSELDKKTLLYTIYLIYEGPGIDTFDTIHTILSNYLKYTYICYEHNYMPNSVFCRNNRFHVSITNKYGK